MLSAMPGFRRLNDLELDARSEAELIDYIRRARAAGDHGAVKLAVQMLAFGQYEQVRGRVRIELEGRPEADVDALAGAVIEGAMLAVFRGESVGEFRSLITRILQRRVADYYRSLYGKARTEPLATEHEGDEEIWGEVPPAPEELSGVWARDLVARAMADLSSAHRAVVEHRLAGHSSKEVAELVNNHLGQDLETAMSADNVDQITSRFRRRLRDLIDEAEQVDEPNEHTSEDDDD